MKRRPPRLHWWELLLFLSALYCLFMLIFVLEPLPGAPT